MSETAVPCHRCGRVSAFLCDGVIAIVHPEPGAPRNKTSEHYTCDRPLCDGCRHTTGHYHICSRRCKGKGGCHVDTFDYCPQCVEEGRHDFSIPGRQLVMPRAEAVRIQAARLKRGSSGVAQILPLFPELP